MQISFDRKVLLVISAALIVFILAGVFLGRVAAVEGTYDSLRLFNEALYLVVNNYVQPIDIATLMEGSYRGLLESLDPGNEYLTPSQYRQASRGIDAGPAGIGVRLSKRRGYAVVVSVTPGSPAAEVGMRSGDLLLSINGKATRLMGVWEAEQSLRGEAGSTVEIVRNAVGAGREREKETIERRVVSAAEPDGTMVESGVGVVRIADIRKGDARRLNQTIASLERKGMERLLLDLRGCSSDSLAESIGMASLFISEGTVVTVTDRHAGDKAYKADGRKVAWNGPMALLVDEGTAQACEILVAALRDTFDMAIVGERTWGLGSNRALLPLRNGDGVFLAVGRFLSPAGKSWHGEGIEPDLVIPGDEFEEDDQQRQRAIDYLSGISGAAGREAA